MLYTDAFKGTAYLYVGEGFSGGEDVLFAVMEVSPPPLSYNVDPQRQHTHTNINVQLQVRKPNIPCDITPSTLSCYGLLHFV